MRGSVKAPVVGERMSVDWARRVVEELRASRILPGVGYNVCYSRNGTRLAFGPTPYDMAKTELETSSELHPWKVRWMSHDDEDATKGEWQVYAPSEALRVIYDGWVLFTSLKNAKAKDKDGKEIDDWYKIEGPQDQDAEAEFDDGAGLKWVVWLRITPWGEGVVTTVKTATPEEKCLWEVMVATISVFEFKRDKEDEDGNKEEVVTYTRKVKQIAKEDIVKTLNDKNTFAIEYWETSESNAKIKACNIVNQVIMVGRQQVEKKEPTEITDEHESVWVKISHPAEEFSIDVVMEDPGKSNDDQTCFKIYDLRKQLIVKDYRDTIPPLPFYTNVPDEGNESGENNEAGDGNN